MSNEELPPIFPQNDTDPFNLLASHLKRQRSHKPNYSPLLQHGYPSNVWVASYLFDILSLLHDVAVLWCLCLRQYTSNWMAAGGVLRASDKRHATLPSRTHPPPRSSIRPTTVQKIPGGENVQALVGTSILLGLCAVPVWFKNTKAGHDLFSQEKPQAIVDSESKLRREYMDNKNNKDQ